MPRPFRVGRDDTHVFSAPPHSVLCAYVKRGTLDADLAEVMKKLAKDKELRAKSDVAYAKGAYEKEMEQAALLAEAKIHI